MRQPATFGHDVPIQADFSAVDFSDKHVKPGLYRAAGGMLINADVNGAYNIIRKGAPEAFTQGSRGCIVHPVRLTA
jgi:hypothetical protein